MARLKKFFVVSTMFVTIFALTVTVAPQAKAASAGDLIKMNGLSSVYYLGSDGKRYVFPNEATYFSWYSDFSSVVTISQSELEALPLGANVTIRPGTKLVKITTNPKVYAVTSGGNLVAVPDEATAKTLWGDNWAKKVVDVPDAFFTNYKISASTVSATAYPAGSLVKFGTGADVYFIAADGKAQKIASEAAFLANRFKWSDVITSTLTLPATGSDITGADSTLTDTSSGAGGTIYTGGSGVTVALSSDTLGSTNLPSYGSLIPFITVNLTAANDGAVTVTDMTFTRFGTGNTSDFSGGYLYSGDTRLTNIRSVDSSANTIQFTSLNIAIPAGQTKSITLRMNAKTSDTVSGSHAFKLAGASAVSASGAAVSGSFPVSGNMMSFSASASAATLTLTSSQTLPTKKVGETQVTMGEYTINNSTANEDVNIYRIKFKQNGDGTVNAVKNFSLDLDGTKVVEGVTMSSDKFVDFVLPTPFLLKKSKSITATVRGDVITDIGKTVELYLTNIADMDARGSAYGNFYSAMITNTSWTAGTVQKTTINGANINVSLDGPNASDVKRNTTNVVFAKLLMKVDNEDVNIENLRMSITNGYAMGDDSALNNVKMVDSANNVSYTTTADPAGAASDNIDFENIYLKKGVQYTFEIKGDIPDTATSTSNSYKFTVNFTCPSPTKGRYQTSDTALATTDFSASSLAGQTMTVNTPTVSFGKVTTNDNTVVKSATKVLLYKGKITAGAVDNIKVSKIPFTVTLTGMASDGTADVGEGFDRLYLYALASDGTETLLDDETSLSSVTNGTNVVFSGFTYEVPKGISGTKYYVVRGDVKSAPTAGTIVLNVKNSAATSTDFTVRDSENNALTSSQFAVNFTAGQTTTIAAKGTFTADFETTESGTNADKNVLGGATYLAGRIKMTAAKETAKVIDLSLQQVGNADDTDVGALYLYKDKEMTQLVGSTALGSSNYAKFENLNFEVPAGTTYLYLAAATKGIDYSASPASASTGAAENTVKFVISTTTTNYLTKVRGVSTGEDYTNGTDSTIGNTVTKQATMLGAIISAISAVYPPTTNASMSANNSDIKVFGFKISVPSQTTNNKDYDGANLGVKIATTTFNISLSSGFMNDFYLQRDGGAAGRVAATVISSTTAQAIINFGATYASNPADLIVRPGEEATFYLYADVNGVSTNGSLKVSINSMSNVEYWHNTTSASTYLTHPFSPTITGTTEVSGGQLNN